MSKFNKIMSVILVTLASIFGFVLSMKFFGREIKETIHFLKSVPILVYILIFTGFAILGIVGFIFYILHNARKEIPPKGAEKESLQDEDDNLKIKKVTSGPKTIYSPGRLKKSFIKALRTLKKYSSVSNYRYEIPWFLMLGESESGKTLALKKSGLGTSLGRIKDARSGEKAACEFWFFEKGLVLDVAGDLILRKDGESSDEKMWRYLLKLLSKFRRERPVDGIIITIPCSDLMEAQNGKSSDLNKIVNKTEKIYKKLWDVQKFLGIRFPIYVLVTKCDEVDGFESFCHGLPKHFSGNIFGWSNPYSIDTAYSDEWADEAKHEIIKDLLEAEYEIFTEKSGRSDVDGIFKFPENFKNIFPPLKIYLNNLFRESAYHESFILRGIYFCGQSPAPKEGAKESGPVFFIKDLFEKKIFPEFGIARPTIKTLTYKTRKNLAFQIAAFLLIIIAFVGLWRDSVRLKIDTGSLKPVLQEVYNDLLRRKTDYRGEGLMVYSLLKNEDESIFFQKNASHLFNLMSEIRSLKKPMIPWSWFSSLHGNIRKAMTYAYGEIILKAMYIGFVQKAKRVFEAAEFQEVSELPKDKLVPIESLPEFETLRSFFERATKLGRYIDIFNNLGKSGNMAGLGQISEYLFGLTMPPDFFTNAASYHKALGDTEYRVFDPTIFKLKAKHFTIKKLFKKLYMRIFDENPLVYQLDELARRLDEFGEDKSAFGENKGSIHELIAMIDKTERMLSDPAVIWIFRNNFDLGTQFNRVLAMISRSRFQGPEVRDDVEKMGEEKFKKFKEKLKNIRLASSDALLKIESDAVQNELSSKVITFKKELKNLLKQSFMAVKSTPEKKIDFKKIDFKPDTRVRWDKTFLLKALKLFDPYELFQSDQLDKFPDEVKSTIDDLAKDRLEKSVEDFIAKAQRFKPISEEFGDNLQEMDMGAEIKNFKKSAKLLHYLLKYSKQLDLSGLYQRLSDFVYWQTGTLLTAIDKLLAEDNLWSFEADDLSWWDGQKPFSLAAFDASDDAELADYLAIQRQRIEHLALDYAAPLVEFFSQTDILRHDSEKKSLLKWKRIISELEKYKNKKPKNSLALLEKYIRFESNKINIKNFISKIPEDDLDKQSGDIFMAKINFIRSKIYERCRQLASSMQSTEYSQLSGFFNENLAGKFPFAPRDEEGEYDEADPDDIKEFFILFNKESDNIRKVLEVSEKYGTSKDHVLEFLDRMEKVREFFTSFVKTGSEKKGAKKEDVPIFDLDVDFRVNREFESGGSRIIEWKLAIDNQILKLGGGKKTGRWRYGDPVTFSLRWAKDGPTLPAFAGDSENVSIDNLTVAYKYDNLWSLIKFMETYAAHPGDLKDGEDKKPHTLAFAIDTTNKGTDLMENISAQRKKLTDLLAKLTFPPKPVKSSQAKTDKKGSSKSSFIGSAIWKETKGAMYRNSETGKIGYGMSSAERIKKSRKTENTQKEEEEEEKVKKADSKTEDDKELTTDEETDAGDDEELGDDEETDAGDDEELGDDEEADTGDDEELGDDEETDTEDDEDTDTEDEFVYEVPKGWRPDSAIKNDEKSKQDENTAEKQEVREDVTPKEEKPAEEEKPEPAPEPEQKPVSLDGLTPKEKLRALENMSPRLRTITLEGTRPESVRKNIIEGLRALDNMRAMNKEKISAKVFIRITLLTPGKSKKVLTMPLFPSEAPELKAEDSEEENDE